MAGIFEGLLRPNGDGFSEKDRELLWRLAQKVDDHIDRNEAWHKDRTDECKEIKEDIGKAHLRINDLKTCIAKKESWFTGVRNTVGTLIAIIMGVVAIILAVIKYLKD